MLKIEQLSARIEGVEVLRDVDLTMAQGATAAMVDDYSREEVEAWQRTTPRNAECPCGSGKKFKHCHGAI